MQQPEASQPDVPPDNFRLADLPEGVLKEVLLHTGVHARQVCRAWRAIHPPPRSLVPHGVDTPEELAAALASLPSSLVSLDLRRVDGGAVTSAALAALYSTVPDLERLTVPCKSWSTLSNILDALHHLPRLHTLYVFNNYSWTYRGLLPDDPWSTLLEAPIATRLRALAIPISALPTIYGAPSCTFPQLTTITFFCKYGWGDTTAAGHQDSLLGPARALRRLAVDVEDCRPVPTAVGRLSALTTLTALSLKIILRLDLDDPMVDVLPPMGTLTGLRCLRLAVQHHKQVNWGANFQDHGWLRRLTLLSQLELDYCLNPDLEDPVFAVPPPAHVISELVQAAVALPQLQDLRLRLSTYITDCCDLGWLACGTEHSFFSHLATATQLHRLQLCSLPLPPAEACLLSRLQGLTSLHLQRCTTPQADAAAAQPRHDGAAATAHDAPPAVSVHWLEALTGLRELVIEDSQVPRLVQAAAALPHLHTVDLRMAYITHTACLFLERLQGVLVRLELDFPSDTAWDVAVLRMLGSMTRLQTLFLIHTGPAMLRLFSRNLLLPASLTQCYLPPEGSTITVGYRRALRKLRARYPLVFFKPYWPREDWLDKDWPMWD